ncbi:hypothetical protein HK096_006747, partial [Nowakowskiella sp. JEL0078]
MALVPAKGAKGEGNIDTRYGIGKDIERFTRELDACAVASRLLKRDLARVASKEHMLELWQCAYDSDSDFPPRAPALSPASSFNPLLVLPEKDAPLLRRADFIMSKDLTVHQQNCLLDYLSRIMLLLNDDRNLFLPIISAISEANNPSFDESYSHKIPRLEYLSSISNHSLDLEESLNLPVLNFRSSPQNIHSGYLPNSTPTSIPLSPETIHFLEQEATQLVNQSHSNLQIKKLLSEIAETMLTVLTIAGILSSDGDNSSNNWNERLLSRILKDLESKKSTAMEITKKFTRLMDLRTSLFHTLQDKRELIFPPRKTRVHPSTERKIIQLAHDTVALQQEIFDVAEKCAYEATIAVSKIDSELKALESVNLFNWRSDFVVEKEEALKEIEEIDEYNETPFIIDDLIERHDSNSNEHQKMIGFGKLYNGNEEGNLNFSEEKRNSSQSSFEIVDLDSLSETKMSKSYPDHASDNGSPKYETQEDWEKFDGIVKLVAWRGRVVSFAESLFR